MSTAYEAGVTPVETPPASFDSFDSYVRAYPQAEEHREWLTGFDWSFVRILDQHHVAFPGGYLRLAVFPLHERIPREELGPQDRATRKGPAFRIGSWRVYLADSDDWELERDFPADQELAARQLFADIKASAPFTVADVGTVYFAVPEGRNKPKRSA